MVRRKAGMREDGVGGMGGKEEEQAESRKE